MFIMAPELVSALEGSDPFSAVMKLEGERFRDLPGRRTLRVRIGAGYYFVKLHYGVGWWDILRNVAQLRLPVLSARTEWLALQRLEQLGIATTPPVGFGIAGFNPARLRSFLITAELAERISLEDYCAAWREVPPEPREKWRLIAQVAELARRLHGAGINHRDFYLCHFLLDPRVAADDLGRLALIDLHRAQLRREVPRRWLVKDLGSLYFSALDCGLTARDLLRFIRDYRGAAPAGVIRGERSLWRQVVARAVRLYRPFHRREPPGVVPRL